MTTKAIRNMIMLMMMVIIIIIIIIQNMERWC
jgi:hypothetical protein